MGSKMFFKGISFELLSNIEAIPAQFRIIWSGHVLDSRTIKASHLKLFADEHEMWGDMRGNLSEHSDAVLGMGSDRQNKLRGSEQNDFILGQDGNDKLIGGGGADFLSGGHGDDTIKLGSGFFNRAKGGDGDDMIRGGAGMDWAHGNSGNDFLRLKKGDDKGYGGSGDDVIHGGGGRDWLQGAMGDDTLYGGAGRDTMHGGMGDDVIEDRKGRDWLDGGSGNDTLISRSDAGTPDMKVDDVDISTIDFEKWSDRLTGGDGADEFRFIYEMNTTEEIAARNLNADGSVNWMMVMRENMTPHAHWVDWGGTDRIEDFDASEGDTIVIEGHTVNVMALDYVDLDNNLSLESTLITVYSDQTAQMMMMGMGGMPMSHDRDFLGVIVVENAIIDMDDITLDNMSMEARFDFI